MSMKKAIQPTSAEPIVSTYLNRKGIRLGLPVTGNFELTARCNFDCRMCYVHLKGHSQELIKKELTAAQWLDIAKEAKDMGLIFLLLTGGEPFLRSDFPYIYEELIRMGIMVSINTNASLYNEEIRKLFHKYPPSRLNVTLYGGSEETYQSLCGNASFEKVTDSLRRMKEDGLQIRLNVSLTPYNVQDMKEIDRISREIGLQAKAASYMYPPVRVTGEIGSNSARFTPEEAGKTIADWYYLRDDKERFLKRANACRMHSDAGVTDICSDVEQEGVSCRAGRSSFWLTWDGRMLPCGTMDIESSNVLEKGFAESWEEVRSRVSAIRLPKECSGCDLRHNCGVCAANCKTETGYFDHKPEYLCKMTQCTGKHILELADQIDKH